MFKLVVVLFALCCARVSNTVVTKDYVQPAATSYSASEDGEDGKQYGFEFSKEYGYNKMIVSTHLIPIPEEGAATYTNYVIHPTNKESKDNLAQKPIVIEDTAQMSSLIRLYPIIAEDNDETEGQLKSKYKENTLKGDATVGDGNTFRPWRFDEEPKGETVLDDDVRALYLEWFEREGPRATTESEHWKSFKNKFDALYGDKFREFFGDDYESHGFDKKKKEKDYFADFPKFEYGGKIGDKGNKWSFSYVYEPYNFDDYFNDDGWWHKW